MRPGNGHGLDPETRRLTFTDRLERLVDELGAWQGELRLDVARAEVRGFRWLAGDLRRLRVRVEGVLVAARELAR